MRPWTSSETQRAVRLKAEGADTYTIALAVGRTIEAVRSRFKAIKTPESVKAERKARAKARRSAVAVKPKLPASNIRAIPGQRPSADQVQERDVRFSWPRSFMQIYLGDPLPGQSALDKRKQEACHG